MLKYVEKEEVLKDPHFFTTLNFSLRSDYELVLLHHLFIKTISQNATVSYMVNSIKLLEKIVLEEFIQVCKQGYLNSSYQLTDYAKEYLEFVNFIDELKTQIPLFYIIFPNEKFAEEISSEPISSAIEMRPGVSQYILENLGFSWIKNYLSVHFDFLKNKSSGFIEKIKETGIDYE